MVVFARLQEEFPGSVSWDTIDVGTPQSSLKGIAESMMFPGKSRADFGRDRGTEIGGGAQTPRIVAESARAGRRDG